MWCPLFLVLLVGAASAEHYQAWKTETEYQYIVRGRTLAALHDISDQYTGILLKAVLTVQPKSKDTLQAKVSKAQFARIHTKLPEGWKSEISDSMVDFKQLPLSEKVFEIKMKNGVVRDLIVDKEVPTWDVNVLKSIVSQLQVDTQGENLMPSRYNQEPEENRVNAMFKTMEDSVGGRCEVLYDISPLAEYGVSRRSEWSPNPEFHGEGEAIDIVKTKNFTNCEQRVSHHFGITGSSNFEPSHNNGNSMSRSTISRIIITGDLKTYTIQSSVTTDKVVMSPNFYENEKGMVGSRVNITLVKMGPASSGPWSTPANPESTGNLVYNFNNPFAGPGEDRRPGQSQSNSNARYAGQSQWNSNARNSGQSQWNSNGRNRNEGARFSDDNDQDDVSSRSESSQSANSLESNEQQKSSWQPKPTLNEAPSTPLLPFFIGNGGKSIQTSTDIDIVVAAKSLASQIGSDLQNPSSITEEQTLEKFTILARILRTMSTQQIAEAQRELYQSPNEIDPNDESQSVRRSTWIAFRDAVAQAGTGPALATIKNWIKEKKIKGFEAASVVGVLSKTARTPTPEYMDAFFEMATMPETTNQEFLNSTAIITFAELVRYSQVNHASAHNRYPVHSFGRLSPKHNPAIYRDYIPHMAERLKKAIENNESSKSHVFIRALGAIAHPKILAVLEPYLEGKSQASTFQRLMMVMSLNKLASLRPRLARGVLYRIYQNTAEAHQLRCAAVIFLVSTNPPESMLQRMAEFTNHDSSKQVNAAVKSAIESASELTTPEAQDLATKARNVLSLLNKETYGFEYSKNYLVDYAVEKINLAAHIHAAQIGSEDSFIPQAFYTSMKAIYGDLATPKSETGAMVSSVKDLFSAWSQNFNEGKDQRKQQDENQLSPENIAKMLNFESKQNDHIEGAMWSNNLYANRFLSFDRHSLHRIPDLIRRASDSLKNGYNFNMANMESYDVTLSFPMESGLPFVYTFKAPTVLKVSGSMKGQNNPESVEGSLDIRVVHAVQLQARLGFVTPFEHQHYLAGVNQDYHTYLPLRAKINYAKSEKRVTLKLEPNNQNEKSKVMESRVTPYTSHHDVQNFSPVMKDKETYKLISNKVWKKQNSIGSRTHGLNIKIQSEGDSDSMTNPRVHYSLNDPLSHLIFGYATDKIGYWKTEVFLVPNQSSSQSIIISASFETSSDYSKQSGMKRNEKPRAKAPQIKSKKLNDPERRKQLLEEAATGINAADAFAIDLGIDLPGQEPSQVIATLAYANSKVDEKSQGVVYFRVGSGRDSVETCGAFEVQSPKASIFDMEIAGKSPMTSKQFDIELRAGVTCEDSSKIRINGNQEQSESFRESVKKLPSMLKCLNEAKRGSKSLAACQKMSIKLSTMDEAHVSIKFDPQVRNIKEEIASYLNSAANFDNMIKYGGKHDRIDENTLEFNMSLDPSKDSGLFSYESSNIMVYFPDVDLGPFASFIGNSDPDLSTSERINTNLNDANSHEHACAIESETATTFDQANYPVQLGKCWHVAFTTSPNNNKESRSKNKVREDMKMTVLVRDGDHKNKEVKFIFGNTEIEMKKEGNNVRMTVNGNNVNLNENAVYSHKNGEESEFEVFQRPDASVGLQSSKYDVEAVFDGQHVQLKASGKYRGEVRGLCGNYNGEPHDDFMGPKNCLLKKADMFAASYALTKNDCQGPAQELSKKVDEAECNHKTTRPGNVVSDREAGRSSSGQNNWGNKNNQNRNDENDNRANNKRCTTVRTKVIEEEDQTCFSLRPVPSCADGCQASRTKSKIMPMHCMPNGSAANQLASRIKQGANPDLSQKQYSKKLAFEMPVSCNAA